MSFRRRVTTICDYLSPTSDQVILDAGCGEGFVAIVLEQVFGCKVVGLDSDDNILNRGLSRDQSGSGNRWLMGDVTSLPFPDSTFDGIVCSEVLEHVDGDVVAVSELERVLKPNGVLAITVPCLNYPGLWDPLNRVREALKLGHFNPASGFWGGLWAEHLRLYTRRALIDAFHQANELEIDRLEGLTRYCLPFNHMILWTLKQLYTRLSPTSDIHQSMEKFMYDLAPRTSLQARAIAMGLRLIRYVDARNDKMRDPESPCVNISLRAVKAIS